MVTLSCSTLKQGTGVSRQTLYKSGTGIEPTLFWAHYDATQRGGIYMVVPVPAGGGTNTYRVQMVSENPPDAAMSSTIDALAKAKVGGKVDAEAKFNAVRAVAELGQRNAANYIIRDIAYRLEALQNNGGITPEILTIYKELLATAERVSMSQDSSPATVAKEKAELVKQLNDLLGKADPAAAKPTPADLLKKVEEMMK